jgi:acyl dehydratase
MLGAQVMRIDGTTRSINFGSNKVRFTSMVPVGSRVRLKQKCLSIEPRAGGKQIIMESTIEIEGSDRPACVAETIGITYG